MRYRSNHSPVTMAGGFPRGGKKDVQIHHKEGVFQGLLFFDITKAGEARMLSLQKLLSTQM